MKRECEKRDRGEKEGEEKEEGEGCEHQAIDKIYVIDSW